MLCAGPYETLLALAYRGLSGLAAQEELGHVQLL